jgi:DNA-binding transcriptional LysR family regulator
VFDLRRSDVALLQAVSDHGSLHAVERGGRMTQSSASRRLIKLERRLRTALVSRGSTGTELTEAGHALLHAGRRLLGAIDFAIATAHHEADVADRLPVVQFAVGTEWAYGLGRGLTNRFPEVVFDVVPGDCHDIWKRFERYAVDAAFGWETARRPAVQRGDTLVRTVVEEPQWVALHHEHPLARRDILDLHDLIDAEWVAVVGGDSGDDQGRAFTRIIPAARVSFTVRSQSAALDLVGRGYAAALVSPASAEREHETRLVLRPLRQKLVRRLCLAVDQLAVPLPLTLELCAWLRSCYVQRAAGRDPARASVLAPPTREAISLSHPRGEAGASVTEPRPVLLSELHWSGADPSSCFEAEHLHLLRAIDRIGSLNRAADALMVTQPALTRRLHRLEVSSGLRLVHSTARGTSLSGVARRLLVCTGPAERRLDALVGRLRERVAPAAPGNRRPSATRPVPDVVLPSRAAGLPKALPSPARKEELRGA